LQYDHLTFRPVLRIGLALFPPIRWPFGKLSRHFASVMIELTVHSSVSDKQGRLARLL
jgi:hypothetical protein